MLSSLDGPKEASAGSEGAAGLQDCRPGPSAPRHCSDTEDTGGGRHRTARRFVALVIFARSVSGLPTLATKQVGIHLGNRTAPWRILSETCSLEGDRVELRASRCHGGFCKPFSRTVNQPEGPIRHGALARRVDWIYLESRSKSGLEPCDQARRVRNAWIVNPARKAPSQWSLRS